MEGKRRKRRGRTRRAASLLRRAKAKKRSERGSPLFRSSYSSRKRRERARKRGDDASYLPELTPRTHSEN